MTHVWERWEGVSLAGEYALQQCLGSDSSGAFFLTTFGPGQQPAIVKLVPEDPSTADAQLAMWRRTARLTHPNLLPVLDCGRTDAGGDSLLFVVFEQPEDSLAGAAKNGPLSEDEAREVLVAGLDALRYIHAEGLVHTSIDAEHIVAVGDRIKLVSDPLEPASDRRTAYADDIRTLGALIGELSSGNSEALSTMVQHALVEAQALPPAPMDDLAVAKGPFEARAPLAAKPPAAEPLAREDSAPGSWPSAAPTQTVDTPQPKGRSSFARYVPLAAVLAMALVAAVFVISHRAAPPPVVPAVAPPAAAVAPPPAAVPALRMIPQVLPARPNRFQTWRVIAYTYSHFKDAEKKAHSINSRFTGFHAEVFTLGRGPSSYLVSLGSHLTREEAAALQRKALAKGLPRDTFIRNFAD